MGERGRGKRDLMRGVRKQIRMGCGGEVKEKSCKGSGEKKGR